MFCTCNVFDTVALVCLASSSSPFPSSSCNLTDCKIFFFSHFPRNVCHINNVMLICPPHLESCAPSTVLFLPHACCPGGQQRSRVLTRLNCSEAEVNFQLNRDKWLCFDLLAGTTKTLCFSRRRAQQICVIWKQLFIILPYEMIW